MEDVIMESVESLNGSSLGDKLIKAGLDEDAPLKILPKLFYSREVLMKLRKHPLSKEKPSIFDLSDYVSKSGLWDPEHWHSRTAKDSKRPTSTGNKEEQQDKKRGKDDGDEFCFTPQRRSFVSGCHVAPTRRQDPEPVLPPIINETARDSALATRRVGSGRLTGRDAEPVPVKETRDRREPLRAPQRERVFEREPPRNERNDRNSRAFPSRADPRDNKGPEKDRRNFERGYERDYGGRGDRYNDRRKQDNETPEWFFGGPSSQHDTIELRGFDEEKDKKGGKSKRETAKERQPAKKAEEVNGSSRPGSGLSGKVEEPKRKPTPTQDQMDFNIDDFLKLDSDGINGLGLGESESKASRWFGKTTEQPEPKKEVKEDPARSLLEMMQKGSHQPDQKKIVTAEELERSSGKFRNHERNGDDGLTVFNKLLAQVQENTGKPHAVMSNAPTEQDILANLLGKQMKIESQPPPNHPMHQHHQPPQQDALSKFLQQQHNNQMQQPNNQHQVHHQPPQHHMFQQQNEQVPDMHALMRDVANGLLSQNPQTMNQLHLMALQQQHHQQQMHHQQQHHQQQMQRQNFGGSPQQPAAKQATASSSPLSFTPTAVMRKMTAEKDRIKPTPQEKIDDNTTSSPPAISTSNRLTGRTASQVQGATRVSNQLRMNDPPVAQQQQPQQQQQLLTGRPLVKGQEMMPLFQPQQQQQHVGNRPFGMVPTSTNAAITGVAVKMLEQQQQHQLLAAAVAASANQTQQQIKQQLLQQQQQRTSPLQQSLLAFAAGGNMQNRGIPANVPVGNRTHFRPIHPQPMIPPISGYSPFMANQAGLQQGQNRLPNNMGSSNQFYGVPANLRGQAQGLNALAALQQQALGGQRSPNMLQGGNPLSRWFPPEILSQAAGQMPSLPPMPNQKILSLEELERLHTSPMSH